MANKCPLILFLLLSNKVKRELKVIEIESHHDNDELDPLEKYFRKNRKEDDDDTYYPREESEQIEALMK